ncbi:MAG: hypothetical protein ACREP9_06055, partial [Candidatus Dormibacteraceae bacterium]
MIALASLPRPRLPTLFSIYQRIEEYWRTCCPIHEFGTNPERMFPPLDAFLIHLILERLPDVPVLIDLAAECTGGASSVLGLVHLCVQSVMAGSWLTSTSTLAALEEYQRRHCPSAHLKIRPSTELLGGTVSPRGAVLLMDAKRLEPDVLADTMTRWCDS